MINIFKESFVNILPSLSKTINELEKKVMSLVNAINKAINAPISRAKLCQD